MPHPTWPVFDLRISTGDVELRLPSDDEISALCELAREGVHDPATMPFLVPWTDKPSPRFERECVQYHWLQRATWTPERWSLDLACFVDGEIVGTQGLFANGFPVLRQVGTGSWVGRRFQGRGIGRHMRTAILHFAFDGLGAQAAHSGAIAGNTRSLGVSRALGYVENGTKVVAPRGEPTTEQLLVLTRERWACTPHAQVTITGLDACRDLFG